MRGAISTAGVSTRQRAALPSFSELRLVAVALLLVLGSLAAFGHLRFWTQTYAFPLYALCTAAYLGAAAVSSQFTRFGRTLGLRVGIVGVTLAFALVLAVILFWRLYYSRPFLLTAYVTALSWQVLESWLAQQKAPLRLAVVPGGAAADFARLRHADCIFLQQPFLEERADAVVVDLHDRLAPEWVRFLADCSLKGMPTYHAAVAYEALTGRVFLGHLSAGLLDEFRFSPVYAYGKRLLDLLFVLLTLPLAGPLMLLTALAIKIESPGPVLFWQERVGEGGKPFRMVKFRSMCVESEAGGARFAAHGDDRVTRIGRFIRKMRVDELPQYWNILKGEMSLIGPRPEQVSFVRQFEQEIPFYAYRHLVKPGITGWAQVNHGYAASVDETRGKLEHDLYYIKHFSFWLDALIVFGTIRTVLTGFGAR